MKLWLLKKREDIPNYLNPWGIGYDCSFGFVIRAEDEAQARILADQTHGEETSESCRPWLSQSLTTCIELLPEGKPGIILQDFYAG